MKGNVYSSSDRTRTLSVSQAPGLLRRTPVMGSALLAIVSLSLLYVANVQSEARLQSAQSASTSAEQKIITTTKNTGDETLQVIATPDLTVPSTDIQSDTTIQTDTEDTSRANLDIRINGQRIDMPPQGETSIVENGTRTDISVSQGSGSDGTATNSNQSSTTLRIDSSSDSSVSTDTDIRIREQSR